MEFTHGMGDGKKTGCLMTMSNALAGYPLMLDKSTSQCDVLRSFIIATNDKLPLEVLAKAYASLAEEILGTKTKDPNILRKRAIMLAEWADAVPLPPRYVIRKKLVDEVIALLDKTKPENMLIVACEIAARASTRAINVMAAAKTQVAIAEACRDIIRKIALADERQPVPIVNTELQKELAVK